MALLSMNEITTFRWSMKQDVENYVQAGYRAIGLWRQKVSDCGDDEAIELLAESDLCVSCLSWAGGFTGSDGRSTDESIEDAVEALRLAAGLSAGCLVIYAGGRNNHTYRHAIRLLHMALEELLPLAETVEVPLAIEPMHPACAGNWTFLTDLASVVSLIDEYRSPYLKLAYDTYQFPLGAKHRHILTGLAPYLGIVHLGDRRAAPDLEQERCPLGQGTVPLSNIVTTLQTAGYSGPFDVKLVGSEIESKDYWRLLEQAHDLYSNFAPAPVPRFSA